VISALILAALVLSFQPLTGGQDNPVNVSQFIAILKLEILDTPALRLLQLTVITASVVKRIIPAYLVVSANLLPPALKIILSIVVNIAVLAILCAIMGLATL